MQACRVTSPKPEAGNGGIMKELLNAVAAAGIDPPLCAIKSIDPDSRPAANGDRICIHPGRGPQYHLPNVRGISANVRFRPAILARVVVSDPFPARRPDWQYQALYWLPVARGTAHHPQESPLGLASRPQALNKGSRPRRPSVQAGRKMFRRRLQAQSRSVRAASGGCAAGPQQASQKLARTG